jgi:hypothetical protein
MNRTRRSNLVIGGLLILLGAWFLLSQWVPGWPDIADVGYSWPLPIIAFGVLLLIIGVLGRAPAMAVPAAVIGGLGGLMYWQNVTGHWESWAYVWTLIPGFAGVGIVLMGLFGGDSASRAAEGGRLIFISLVMFTVFGSFFGALDLVGPYWPVLLIALGVLILIRRLFRA